MIGLSDQSSFARPTRMGQWPARRGSGDEQEGHSGLEWVELAGALVTILFSAELFTNGVEWIGENLGLSEGAVGSVLAAVGTALPETLLPLVAILIGHEAGREIGIGAILGAPFMLSTLAMFVVGTATLILARDGKRSTDLHGDRRVLLQDLGYFLAMYTLALVAGLFHPKWFKWLLALGLMVGYAFYVKRHFESPKDESEELEAEAAGEVKPLYLRRWIRRLQGKPVENPTHPPTWASITQTIIALVAMVAGARIFVLGIDRIAEVFRVPHLALALLIAPVATELPEKFNSVIWVRRRKDTLALGNLTGAMVFQSSFPVMIGLLLTPWRFTGAQNLESLVAALVALTAGSVLWLTLKLRGSLGARLLLAQGAFFVGYVIFVLVRI
jgi:cation:H+ antiporter